jgi:hypothetical protein
VALVERAIAAGARRIEVTSFVNPKAVPQMADAEAVCARLPQRADVTYIGLVMNARGAARAIETGRIDQLGAVSVATDTFAKANQGQTSQGSVAAASEIIAMARQAGKTGQVTIAAAFGCPFEGEVAEARVVAMAEALAKADPVEIGLADTIGVGNPACRLADRQTARRRAAHSGAGSFPQHARHRPCQCLGGDRRGRGERGCGDRRAGRLPVRAGCGGQRLDRGRGLHAGARRRGHRA